MVPPGAAMPPASAGVERRDQFACARPSVSNAPGLPIQSLGGCEWRPGMSELGASYSRSGSIAYKIASDAKAERISAKLHPAAVIEGLQGWEPADGGEAFTLSDMTQCANM